MQPPRETSDYFISELISGKMRPDDVERSINDAIRQSQPQQQQQLQQQQQHVYVQDFSDVQTPTIIDNSSVAPSAPMATESMIVRIEERDRNMELMHATSPQGIQPPPPANWQQRQQQEYVGPSIRQPSPPTGISSFTSTNVSASPTGPAGLRLDQVTEYVDRLFEKYAGSVKNADVVHRKRIISEIMAGKLSVKLAELEIKMRPESKKYMAEQEKIRKAEQKNLDHMKRCKEYVTLLAQKYTPSDLPTAEEVDSLVMELCQGTKSYQDVEDYFTMKALSSCPTPYKKY